MKKYINKTNRTLHFTLNDKGKSQDVSIFPEGPAVELPAENSYVKELVEKGFIEVEVLKPASEGKKITNT